MTARIRRVSVGDGRTLMLTGVRCVEAGGGGVDKEGQGGRGREAASDLPEG